MRKKQEPRRRMVAIKGMSDDVWAEFAGQAKRERVFHAEMFERMVASYMKRRKK